MDSSLQTVSAEGLFSHVRSSKADHAQACILVGVILILGQVNARLSKVAVVRHGVPWVQTMHVMPFCGVIRDVSDCRRFLTCDIALLI
jgi:hypothetical protein